MSYKIGDKVKVHYLISVTGILSGKDLTRPGPRDGQIGEVMEVLGTTYRIKFPTPGRDAFLGTESLELA